MTPGARLKEVMTLLDLIAGSPAPADRVLDKYFRENRYIGSKDRRDIADRVFRILAHKLAINWHIQFHGLEPSAKLHVLTFAILNDGVTLDDLQAMTEERHGFRPFRQNELDYFDALSETSLYDDAMPEHVKLACPEGLLPLFKESLPNEYEDVLKSLTTEPPVTIRVNTLKATKEDVIDFLAKNNLEFTQSTLTPLALHLTKRQPLATFDEFKDGWFEVQDEGSQVLAEMVEAKPGLRVLDYCAGAGGKSLALAAAMNNKGHLLLSDIDERRLERAKVRLRRGGVSNHEIKLIDKSGWQRNKKESFDRVVVDAPCTGTGTWRRNADARWRYGVKDVVELQAKQLSILEDAAQMVKKGGRLIYMTCSIMKRENEDVVENFLTKHTGFKTLKSRRLNPPKTNTDGFFACVMEKI